MKRLSIIVVLLAVAALGGLFHAPTSVSAAPAGVMHSKGAGADALFIKRNPGVSDCIEWDTWVSAGVWTDTSSPGRPVERSVLKVQIDVWNVCGGEELTSLRGFTEAADVKLSLQHASAAGIVEVRDYRGNSETLDVSVDWGAENAPPSVTDGELPDPICTFQGNAHVRAATATGTVAEDYPGGPKFTSGPSAWADAAAGHGALCIEPAPYPPP